eukprot:764874-Hanusia_phi.AAC.1
MGPTTTGTQPRGRVVLLTCAKVLDAIHRRRRHRVCASCDQRSDERSSSSAAGARPDPRPFLRWKTTKIIRFDFSHAWETDKVDALLDSPLLIAPQIVNGTIDVPRVTLVSSACDVVESDR